MKNIHILPTDKPSRLYKQTGVLLLDTISNISKDGISINQNIYITSNEEIKVGDWVIEFQKNDNIGEVHFINGEYVIARDIQKKIILTTDQDLIKDGVQAIDDEFLEWFVKNPSCEWIEVVKDRVVLDDVNYNFDIVDYKCKIIIPKEEPKQDWQPIQGEQVWIKVFSNWSKGIYIGYDIMKGVHIVREPEEGGGNLLSSNEILPYKAMPNESKKETLEELFKIEEAAENYSLELLEAKTIQPHEKTWIKSMFIRIARWQKERMYSEEEVLEIIRQYALEEHLITSSKPDIWFEQFKKK
jgi:hypothetical protein